MTSGPPNSGPLNWLPSARAAHADSARLWQPFQQRLTVALADLREGQFIICNISPAPAETRAVGSKYLQYLLDDDEDGRILVAEASALRYQVVTTPESTTEQSLIDGMGWTRPDNENHQRLYKWPLGVHSAVEDSLRILRDIWAVPHPHQVTIEEPESIEP